MDDLSKEGTGTGCETGCAAHTRSLAVLPLCFLDQQYLSFSSTLSILVNVAESACACRHFQKL